MSHGAGRRIITGDGYTTTESGSGRPMVITEAAEAGGRPRWWGYRSSAKISAGTRCRTITPTTTIITITEIMEAAITAAPGAAATAEDTVVVAETTAAVPEEARHRLRCPS